MAFQDIKSGAHDRALDRFSLEDIIRAYQLNQNLSKPGHQVAPEYHADYARELRERGVDPSQIQVTPTGKIERNTGLRSVGKAVGGVLKTIAPAAALIPGLGIPLAAGLAAGGRALGGALSGDKFNLGGTLAAGAAGAAGSAALGGQGYRGVGSLFGGGGGAAIDPAAEGALRGATGGGGGGLLGGAWDFIKSDPERAARLGLGAVGALQASQAAGRADDLQKRALAPLYGNSPNPFANVGVDEGNPYSRNQRRTGQASLNATLGR